MTPNEPNAMAVHYYLKDKAAAKVNIKVSDPYGKVLRELAGKQDAGMNSVLWDMRAPRPQGQGSGFAGGGFGPGGGMVDPGEYVVTLEVGDKKLTKKALVTKRTGWALGPFPSVIR